MAGDGAAATSTRAWLARLLGAGLALLALLLGALAALLLSREAAPRADREAAPRADAAAPWADAAAPWADAADRPGPAPAPAPRRLPAPRHTSDAQNVHDRAVNAALPAIVARLRAGGPPAPLAAVRAALLSEYALAESAEARTLALAVLDRVEGAPAPSAAAGCTDAEAVGLVWARAEAPENAAARGALRRALVDALRDCVEGGALVCAGGRVAKVLGALARLDADAANWALQRAEDLRNELFAAARAEIGRAARATAARALRGLAPAGWPAAARGAAGALAAARAYLDPGPGPGPGAAPAEPVPAAADAALAELIRARVRAAVRAAAAAVEARLPGALGAEAVERFAHEAAAAVM